MLEHNNKFVDKRLEALSVQTTVPKNSVLVSGSSPLYTSVEDSPYYQLNQERHQEVKAHIEVHLRRRERERRRSAVNKAVEYRGKIKRWLAANDLKPPRKSRPAVIPDMLQDRRTRSADKVLVALHKPCSFQDNAGADGRVGQRPDARPAR
jgi:hypothetical protein